MLFTCMMPAYAAGTAETAAETDQMAPFSVLEKIKDFFHRIIEKILSIFGIDCPFCDIDYTPIYMEEAVKSYNDGVNAIKNYKGNVKVKKTEDVSVEMRDLPAAAESIMEAVISSFVETKVYKWDFIEGKTISDEAITDKIEPCGKEAQLDAAGVMLTESVALDNGGTKIRIVLLPEISCYDGTTVTQDAAFNAGAISTVNYAALDLSPLVITKAETTYTATTLEAEYDSQGRIVKLRISSPMDIDAEVKAGIYVSTFVGADIVTEYTFTYVS